MYPGSHLAERGDAPAVVMAGSGRSLTYRELEGQANRLARCWAAAGIDPGDHVAFLMTNSPEVFVVYWAALRSGVYVTAVNHHLASEETAYVIDDCGARSLVVTADLADLATAVAERTPQVELRLSVGGSVDHHQPYDVLLSGQSPDPRAVQPLGADMLYSSGTTGRPKGIQFPLPTGQVTEVLGTVTGLAQRLWGFGPTTTYLSPAPIYHAAPLRFCAATQALGGTVVMMESFDPERALALIEEHHVTHSQWVPTMFVRMLKLPSHVRERYDVSSLQVALHAAAPCPVPVKQAMLDWWGPVLHEYYASTETNGMTIIGPQDWLARPGSVGQAVLGTLRICRDDGSLCAPGEVGAVYVERDVLPFSYHGDPDQTRAAQHPDHPTWTTTGDIGYVDEDDYLFLTDRKAFMIISGGVNIYPQEVEDALALHPCVDDVAVIGVPDPEMGERVKAFVQPASHAVPGPDLEAVLTGHLRERIAGFKLPREWEFRSELPRTPVGKLVKSRLRSP